ncbi:hypothetical protein [Desulfomonile tiedjei]|uniref:Uncharacterized protein n=1 Tax=Desulfomonile tiedjei (strain ATCC 49306 / DSM 6799 / DCB-1) TaxID=706587 RepID=I4CBK8_DESTA|nr:hypothetical protein [Desulfomonile tiedjei]AFM26949.1 hypothetical protein Desti_4315 [Desulfomonile tiedjei DSM 6799]
MRPILAILVWILILGGVAGYLHTREDKRAVAEFRPTAAAGHFTLEIVATTKLEPDPFALLAHPDDKPMSLIVKINGEQVLAKDDNQAQGTPLRLEDVQGLTEGQNELYVEANPPLESAGRAHAYRVTIKRDGETIAEETLWSEPGLRLATSLSLNIPPADHEAKTDHGH